MNKNSNASMSGQMWLQTPNGLGGFRKQRHPRNESGDVLQSIVPESSKNNNAKDRTSVTPVRSEISDGKVQELQ